MEFSRSTGLDSSSDAEGRFKVARSRSTHARPNAGDRDRTDQRFGASQRGSISVHHPSSWFDSDAVRVDSPSEGEITPKREEVTIHQAVVRRDQAGARSLHPGLPGTHYLRSAFS